MCPRKWRKEILKVTLGTLSDMMGEISESYLSRIERGLEKPSGKVLTHYHKLSGGQVTPGDFNIGEK